MDERVEKVKAAGYELLAKQGSRHVYATPALAAEIKPFLDACVSMGGEEKNALFSQSILNKCVIIDNVKE